ncbi:MAG: hypothetical protein K0Q57_11 [Gammaproteobacteria bacterium]|nr:hypothetical protein [Gammaproteobacteria bacterium]
MKFNRNKLIKLGLIATVAASFIVANAAMATTVMDFSDLQSNISATAAGVWRIVQIVITLAGLLLVVKGLVHLKQNYTGSGQEKHLSKGMASLIFGAALFIVVPITHVLVGSVSGDTSGATDNSFTTGTDEAQSLSSS